MNTQVPSILWLHHFPGSASRQKKRKNVEKAHLLLYCLVQERSKSLLIFNWWEQVTWLFLAAGVAGKCSYWLGCDPIPQNSIERTLYHRREACSLMDSRPALPEGPSRHAIRERPGWVQQGVGSRLCSLPASSGPWYNSAHEMVWMGLSCFQPNSLWRWTEEIRTQWNTEYTGFAINLVSLLRPLFVLSLCLISSISVWNQGPSPTCLFLAFSWSRSECV